MAEFLIDAASFWKLDESTGATRSDVAGDVDLTDNNTVTQETTNKKVGSAAAGFSEANNEFLEASSSSELTFGDTSFSIACWVRITNKTNPRSIVAKFNADTGDPQREYALIYNVTADRFRFIISSDGLNVTTIDADNFGSPSANTWYFVYAEHDHVGNTISISVNNGTPNSTAHAGGTFASTTLLRIGALQGGSGEDAFQMTGQIDAVGIWPKVLSSEEITQLYNGGEGREYPFFDYAPPSPATVGGYMVSKATGAASGFLGGYIEGGPFVGPTGTLGGYVLAKAVTGNNLVGLLGGYTKTDGGIKPPSFLGGFVFSIPVVDDGPEFLGGFVSGLNQAEATLGGCTIGRPDNSQFAAARARNLVVATSDEVVKQGLEFDAQIVFKGIFDQSFNAKVDNEKTWQNEINAKVDVQKFRIPPSVFIQSVTAVVPSGELASNPSGQPVPTFDPNGARTYCVVASGTLGDGESWIGARIDFADPFGKNGGFKPLFSVSGITGPPPWSTCHDFDISGLYVISVTAQDNDGMVGSAVSGLNLASGAGFGTHFPAISISGDPRMGFVPPSLQVDFTTISSGVSVPPFTSAQSAASQPSSPTDERIYWNLGNRETSRRKNPTTFYSSPGLYAPKCIFHYTSPSGGQFIISDTLLVGFNN